MSEGRSGCDTAACDHDQAPASPAGPPQSVTLHAVVTVFLPFAAGYYLSYLYRQVNAVIADRLQADVGFGAAELGLLTSAYLIGFAAFQLPLGLLLDRFGPRRVHGTLLLAAALGALIFALGQGLGTLWIGRALIGLGVAGGLMAALKAITEWFPQRRWPLINGLFLAMGGLGAISATAPTEFALAYIDWRGLFLALAAATFAVAVAIFLIVPERGRPGGAAPLRQQLAGLAAILKDRFFWRVAPVSFFGMGMSMAILGLWAGPWLRDVAGLPRGEVAATLFLAAVAMTVGSAFWGALAERLERRGVRLTVTLAVGAGIYLLSLLLLAGQWAPASPWPWIFFGLMSNVTTLSYAVLSRHYPLSYSGRANTALNLLVFLAAFATQYGMGEIVALWPTPPDGGYPAESYAVAFAICGTLAALALVWFLVQAKRAPLGVNAPSA